jgi:hypothetical protein
MKFNFRKISAIAASAILTGMTLGVAAAAAYPAPFVSGGAANVAIVYGTGAGVSSLDLVQAGNIQSSLQSKMTTGSGTTSTGVEGESVSLASGTDYLYLLDDLAENRGTLTKADLANVLADQTFTDNDGTQYEFEQTITVGTSTTNRFSFGNSDNDFDDPTVMIELSKTPSTAPMYTLVATFNKAVNLTAADSKGEEITLFGKSYTIGTSTDYNTLILLGGADAQTINVAETVTMEVEGVSHEVTLNGLSDATASVASITVDGQSKTFTEGQTKTFVLDSGEVDVYAKSVFRTGDGVGHVELELGANKVTIEDLTTVKVGSDNTDIEGTYTVLAPTPGSNDAGPGFGNLTKLSISMSAPDNDGNSILAGESFTDPVFGTLKLDFVSTMHGPVFEGEEDTGRTGLSITRGGDRELELEITDKNGKSATIPFDYQGALADDDGDVIVIVEGGNLTQDDYTILNSGDNQHFMELTKVDINAGGATSDVTLKDLLSGDTWTIEDKDFTAGYNVSIAGQTYTITNTTITGDSIKIQSTDVLQKVAVFPYLELVSGKDNRVAFVKNTTLGIAFGGLMQNQTTTLTNDSATFELPSGTVQFRLTNTSQILGANLAWSVDGSSTWTANSTAIVPAGDVRTIVVGNVSYVFGIQTGMTASQLFANITNVSVESAQSITAGSTEVQPSLLYVEHEDKSRATASIEPAVILGTTTSATYDICDTPVFTSSYDEATWDDTKYTGYVTTYGTYVLKDTTDTNQALTRLTYGNAQMYADVYLSEAGAVITPGESGSSTVTQLGDVLVTDAEVSNVATKNLIVVGGSCINSAAAALVGGSKCGAAWTTATGVGSGQFLIKGYATSTLTSKLALLVAGYDAADTVNAATYLKNKAVDTSKEYLGTSATAATLVVA